MNKGFDTRYGTQGRSSRGESSTRLSAHFLLWRLRERESEICRAARARANRKWYGSGYEVKLYAH